MFSSLLHALKINFFSPFQDLFFSSKVRIGRCDFIQRLMTALIEVLEKKDLRAATNSSRSNSFPTSLRFSSRGAFCIHSEVQIYELPKNENCNLICPLQ